MVYEFSYFSRLPRRSPPVNSENLFSNLCRRQHCAGMWHTEHMVVLVNYATLIIVNLPFLSFLYTCNEYGNVWDGHWAHYASMSKAEENEEK